MRRSQAQAPAFAEFSRMRRDDLRKGRARNAALAIPPCSFNSPIQAKTGRSSRLSCAEPALSVRLMHLAGGMPLAPGLRFSIAAHRPGLLYRRQQRGHILPCSFNASRSTAFLRLLRRHYSPHALDMLKRAMPFAFARIRPDLLKQMTPGRSREKQAKQ